MTAFNLMVEKVYYLHRRYGVKATFALLYTEEPMRANELNGFLRLSDSTYDIDDFHTFMVFSFTDESGAYKAAENLLPKLDDYFGTRSSCVALDTFDSTNSPQMVLMRLRQILSQVRKERFSRIEDEKILDSHIPFRSGDKKNGTLYIAD